MRLYQQRIISQLCAGLQIFNMIQPASMVKLPKAFGGLEEREYTITESLHPKDVYRAVANARDYEIYFENSEKTDEEGRFLLGDYKVFGFYKDAENTPITDAELLKRYENIF